jgi:hypothetical protein
MSKTCSLSRRPAGGRPPKITKPTDANDGRPVGPPDAAQARSTGDQTTGAVTGPQEQSHGGSGGTADRIKKEPGLLGRGPGGLTEAEDLRKALEILAAAM